MNTFKTALLAAGLVLLFSCNKFVGKTVESDPFALENEVDSVSYSLGANIAESIKQQGISELDLEAVNKAFEDVLKGEGSIIPSAEGEVILKNYFQRKYDEKQNEAKSESEAWLIANKANEGVVTLESGLQYKVITEGTGEKPLETDQVTVHYHGTFTNGEVFDSSVERGEPAQFPVNGVISGWVEALQLMQAGSKWALYIPSELGYGENPPQGSGIEAHTILIFEVELISIN